MIRAAAAAALVTLVAVSAASAQPSPAAAPGAGLFAMHCATCHTGSDPRIPPVATLRQQTADAIVDTLTTGVMRPQGSALTPAERRAIAVFLSAVPGGPAAPTSAGCTATAPYDAALGIAWGGWGPDAANTRHQASRAGLTAASVPKLTLKWAFGLANATSARSQPTVAGGRVYTGSQSGQVFALDARTGCTAWSYKAAASVRTAITIGMPFASTPPVAFFGDGRANVYAVNADTGALLWTRKVETHPSAHVVGAPTLHEQTLYVTVSSLEEGQGDNANYACCTFRGSLVALSAADGAIKWQTYTIPGEPRLLGKNRGGADRFGPSGAGIWSSPTVDAARGLVYVATGNMYTEPQSDRSDAVVAMRMDTGAVAWSVQLTPKDIFVVGCNSPAGANCGGDVGPDFDFGNSPMLTTLAGGRRLIVIGQKSGLGWALDPDKQGAVVWQYRAGEGSALGGMEFGSTTDGVNAYFPVADGNRATAGQLHAVRLDTGARAWMAAPPAELKCGTRGRGCTPAILAAISSIPGVVFAGANDGGLRAYAAEDGALLWEFDTNREFTTVNGVPARGASMSGPGPAIADGMVFVNSGYGGLGGRPGNVLLAFGIE